MNEQQTPRRFELWLDSVRVADGIELPSGAVAVAWRFHPYTVKAFANVAAIDRRQFDRIEWIDEA